MRRKYWGYKGRRQLGGGKLAVLTLLFWVVSGFIMLSFIHGGPLFFSQAKSADVGKMYIGNIFPTVSRGSNFESRAAMGNDIKGVSGKQSRILSADQSKGILQSMVGSMFPAAEVLDDDLAEEDPGITFDTNSGTSDDTTSGGVQTIDTPKTEEDIKNHESSDPKTAKIDDSKPVVIIYHTHATESYQPVSEGNFHSLKEYGTVREVGDVLTQELEKKGIQVVHDETIHDSPSYNQSYTRSLETVKNLIAKYDGKKIVVDLHRDAAGYTGNVAKTVSVNKENIAKYNLVVGLGNPNVEKLENFANKINKKAEEMYPGFGGRIIEKKYKFNQYVSDNHILLEVGNNENTIDQSKLTGKYFADVLAEVIKEMD